MKTIKFLQESFVDPNLENYILNLNIDSDNHQIGFFL